MDTFSVGEKKYICQNWCGEHKKRLKYALHSHPLTTHTHTELQTRMLLQMNSTRQMDQVIPTLYKLLTEDRKKDSSGLLAEAATP